MLRCQKCIIPTHYPESSFDNRGVCSYCRSHKKTDYQGPEALKDHILSFRNGREDARYDCAVGFSGGRDSTYLLFYLSRILKLRVVAFTIDNGYMPPETMENVRSITKMLGVDLVTRKYSYFEDCFGHHLRAWLRKPTPAMVTGLCVGCRLGLAKGIYELMLRHNVPVYISGGTPFEAGDYKTGLLRIPRGSTSRASLILGYLRQVLSNPKWISNPYAVAIQAWEFIAHYGRVYDRRLRRKGHVTVFPFYDYIRWDENEIVQTLNQLGWQRNSKTGSTWRGDCDVAGLKVYLYRTLLGYSDKDDSLSALVRDGQLTREEALRRLGHEQHVSADSIESTVERTGISAAYFRQVLDKAPKLV